MTQKTLDFTRFKLAAKYTPAGATPDETITVVATSAIYNLTLQRQGGTLTKFRLTLVEKTDTTKQFRVGIEDVASSSTVDGKIQYILNIRKSGAGNLMLGLANDDDGTDNNDNIIANNLTALEIDSFSKESPANLVVGTGEFAELETKVDTALEEINDESNLLGASLEGEQKAANERQTVEQDAYETAITLQQDTFETHIESEFDNFTASQREITAIVNTGDTKLVDFSSGQWIDKQTLRVYAGVASHDPADNKTLYYELVTGTGVLASNEVGFNYGNYPIAKIVTDSDGEVTSILNYGPAYSVKDNNVVTEIDNTDSPYTVTNGEHTILCDTTLGAITVNLPTAVGRAGQKFLIKNVGTTNAVTIDPNGAETVDESATMILATQYQSATLESNGTNLEVVSSYTPSGGGGGSSFNSLQFPVNIFSDEGITKTLINLDNLLASSYVIPSGKTLIITGVFVDAASNELIWDSNWICYGYTGQFSSTSSFGGLNSPIYLEGNGTKQLSSDHAATTVNGILVDTADLGGIDPVVHKVQSGGSYTVPVGKILVVTNVRKDNTGILYADGNYIMAGDYGNNGRYLQQPLIFGAGTVISMPSSFTMILGYLIDDDWTY